MPKVYIEAYDSEGKQILGNLDGQAVIIVNRLGNYRRSPRYLSLCRGDYRVSTRVDHWKIVDENGKVLETLQRIA